MEVSRGSKEPGVATATSIVWLRDRRGRIFLSICNLPVPQGGAPAWHAGLGVRRNRKLLTRSFARWLLMPATGGMAYRKAYKEKIGFLAGWMQTVIFYPAFLAGYGVTVGRELSEYVGSQYAMPIAMAVILALVALNTLGSKTAGGIQVVSTICKLIPLVLLMVFGFIAGSGENPIFTTMVAEGKSTGAVLGSTLLAVLFAFEGWTNVGAIAGEMKRPSRDMPAIVAGV